MLNVIIDLFSDYQKRAVQWARHETDAARLKVRGMPKDSVEVDSWLHHHAFSSVMENFHQRISVRPRVVKYCNGFSCPDRLSSDFAALVELMRNGRDLTPYLGNNIRKLGVSDFMLNAWGISHFHFRPFAKRIPGEDNDLLFAYVTTDVVYIIGLGCHGEDFKSTRYLKDLQRDFPESLEQFRVEYEHPLDVDSDEYAKCLAANVNAAVSVNGQAYYFPGANADGCSALSYCETIVLHRRLDAASAMMKSGLERGLSMLWPEYHEELMGRDTVSLSLSGMDNGELQMICRELKIEISFRDQSDEMAILRRV